ncbi:MAG: hypothetical protein IAE94_14555 [Chthoniobacterales bacterium]|nr:hypothetical protein [Chthoniobacterales bacterium]
MNIRLKLPAKWRESRVALTSVPWPADSETVPVAASGISQAVPLFGTDKGTRLKRWLFLTESSDVLAEELVVDSGKSHPSVSEEFSSVEISVLSESADKKNYVYRECEAILHCGNNRHIGLRMGLRPRDGTALSWWQWVRAESLWKGKVAEAWRIGGHLVPYGVQAEGRWENKGHRQVAENIAEHCGNSLHGDLFVIVWKCGVIQVTAHFNGGYFHHWPKAIPAHPVLTVRGLDLGREQGGKIEERRLVFGTNDQISFAGCASQFTASYPGLFECGDQEATITPWEDLRILASKDADNGWHYLEPGDRDTLPPGVSRSCWFTIGLSGVSPEVARYQIPPAWYEHCGEIECATSGPAAKMAGRTVEMVRHYTHLGGMDTGRLWRYLRRDQRENRPYQDGPEWDATAASGLFKYSFQMGECPADVWEQTLQHAYHAADVSIYHGSWMPRLECSAELTAPISKYRVGGILHGYLETGDPYLLEITRSVIGVYMAAEWANEPRHYIGRDAYPVVSLLTVWDYTADQLYLDFARQTITRLVSTQNDDGGFSGQGGVGIYSGTSCTEAKEDIGFACGLLSPLAIVEWAIRDPERALPVVRDSLKRWLALMLRAQPEDGIWLSHGSKGEPYALICAAALGSVIYAGRLLDDRRCVEAIRRMLESMNATNFHVAGTHSFLPGIYAHVADASLQHDMKS